MENKMQDSIENRFDKFSKRVVLDFVKYGEEVDNFYLSEVADSAKQEILDFIISEISKAREEGKKEAFTKDEWFMLKLAMNDIFNNGNTAYEEISEKIESYLN